MLSRKIYFPEVNQLSNRTVPEIFKSFKEVYHYYLHCVFRLTTVYTDGYFRPLKSLIESLPGGAFINLPAENEHVPDIERQTRVVK